MKMNVQITTTKQDIKTLLLNYNIGAFLDYKNLSFGYANENFKVTTSEKDVLFRLCKQQSKKDIEKEIHLMTELKQNDYPTSYPILDKKGNHIHELNGHFCLIYEFIEGSQPELNIETAGEIGIAAAKLALIKVKPIYKKVNAISFENCISIISEFKDAKYQYPEIYAYFKEQTFYLKDFISNNLPKGIIHGDYFPDNTIFNGNKLKAIIDFEEFAYDSLLFDLAMAINGFCFKDNTLQIELMNETVRTYNEIRKLTEPEKHVLPYYIQWAAHGMLYWHLRNNMLYELNETQVERVKELMNRVKTLRQNTI